MGLLKNGKKNNVTPDDAARLATITKLIDNSNPFIYAANWLIMVNRGWRFLRNVDLTTDETIDIIKDIQKVHGPINVAMGHPVPEGQIQPKTEAGSSGIYVRDVDNLVDELNKSLEDLEQIERWINA